MSLAITMTRVSALKPHPRNSRTHGKKQIKKIAASINELGFNAPILITDDDTIICGHARLEAAKLLGLTEAPTIRLSHLTPEQVRAYVIADNQHAQNAGWERQILADELEFLIEFGIGPEVLGFEIAQADLIITEAAEADPDGPVGPEDATPEPSGPAITQPGDLWRLGRHALVCSDVRDPRAYELLMAGAQADMIITDPPYNVPIQGHVGGAGKIRHREFVMASGEMSRAEFTSFLTDTLGAMVAVVCDGAIAYVFMDWAHMAELNAASEVVFDRQMNLVVWVKTNGGMGTFYRSQHELVGVYKVGTAAHTNTFGLGASGRYRTNVWRYAGVNTFRAGRMDDLNLHPTVKPVAMIEDAIKDVTRRGQVVLDGFGGSGTTLIAAERCGRVARLVELDPLYCDVIVRRWQAYTGKSAVRDSDGLSFEEAAEGIVQGRAA